MEVLVKERRSPGRQWILINVKEILVGKLFNTEGKCIEHYYRLVDNSGELHDEMWEVSKYDIYTKFEVKEEADASN